MRKEALNINFGTNGVSKLKCDLFRGFGRFEDGLTGQFQRSQFTQGGHGLLGCDPSSQGTFPPAQLHHLSPAPAIPCFPSSLQIEIHLERSLEEKES